MHPQLLIVLVVLCTFPPDLFPPLLDAQAGAPQPQAARSQTADSPPSPNERYIAARKKALTNDSADMEEMAKSLRGTEMEAALELDQKAGQGVLELDAVLWFFAVYDNMQCEPDREVAKAALNNRLGFYSHLLDLEANQAAGQLAFTKIPAVAQAGLRIKDDLRAAKNEIDEMAASLK